MTVLRNIEAKIESLFEGVFGRAFRTNVQPVELARKLVKEMEDHRVISVSRLYVPNEYTIYLSPADREQFDSYEESLLVELQDYLAENARREKYVLLSPPRVLMETDQTFQPMETIEFDLVLEELDPERPYWMRCQGTIVRIEPATDGWRIAVEIDRYTLPAPRD